MIMIIKSCKDCGYFCDLQSGSLNRKPVENKLSDQQTFMILIRFVHQDIDKKLKFSQLFIFI